MEKQLYEIQWPETQHHPQTSFLTVKNNSGGVGGDIMSWGSFSSTGAGKLVRVEGVMDEVDTGHFQRKT